MNLRKQRRLANRRSRHEQAPKPPQRLPEPHAGVAVLDGATVHAAGTLFQRLGGSPRLAIRPINVLALTALLDSFVLFERLLVPAETWEFFRAIAPDDWLDYLYDVVEPVDLDLGMAGFNEFIQSPYVFWALNALIALDQEFKIHLDYRTYVGGDFGLRLEADRVANELDQIERAVRRVWSSDDKNFEWQYFVSNAEHIDPIHAVWRGCRYSDYCASNGYWYVPHELRGRFLDLHAGFRGAVQREPAVNRVVGALKTKYFDNQHALQNGVASRFIPKQPESELLWKQLDMPLVSGRILQDSKTIYDLFERASIFRKDASGFREECARIDRAEAENRLEQAAKSYTLLTDLFESLKTKASGPRLSWSVSLSFPWKVNFGISASPSSDPVPRHLNFVRDIYQSRLLPMTLRTDLVRLFDQDPSEWLRKYGRGE